MDELNKLLDRIKETRSLPSDNALAKVLGVGEDRQGPETGCGCSIGDPGPRTLRRVRIKRVSRWTAAPSCTLRVGQRRG